MEYFYTPEKFHSTDNIDLKEYFEKYSELCENGKFSNRSDISAFQCIDLRLSYERMQKIAQDADVTNFCPIENPITSSEHTIGASSSQTTKKRKTKEIVKQKTQPVQEPVIDRIIPNTEFCVTIVIHKAVKYRLPEELWQRQANVTASHEIIILGSQPLTMLRDAIQCVTDMGFQMENTDTEEITKQPDPQVKEYYPSAFIYIDGVFYNDMRSPNAIDYSEVIRTWAEKHEEIDTMTTADMHTTLISDLKPRFNYPYVYQHRGECEHALIFKSAHLITKSERINRLEYPYLSRLHPNFSHNCSICATNVATRFIVESERLPLGVTYFCQGCYVSYNYEDGERIGEFQAYPLFDRCLKY